MKRTEHPNPQFKRSGYKTLNGVWQFEILESDYVINDTLFTRLFKQTIQVPFCPESALSGIESKENLSVCAYKRTFELSAIDSDKRITINFGAVDYEASVYINGSFAGKHLGGYTPFSLDITKYCTEGENQVLTLVRDEIGNTPSGKQSPKKESFGCFYSRVTGIWQSVFLEFTPIQYIKNIKFYPSVSNCLVDVEVETEGEGILTVDIYFKGKLMGQKDCLVSYKGSVCCPLMEKHLWNVGQGNLYDVVLRFNDDKVSSYFGLREIKFDGLKFIVNGVSVFQRLVLDQGYYAKGLYTAEFESDFVSDITRAISLGFNGARLHQKAFEPLYLYHCDRLGFMVWGEYASWGVEYSNLNAVGNFLNEWRETIERDFNHPSIILWCPLNETWESFKNEKKVRDIRFIQTIYEFTKILDSTRPCVDVSGGYHSAKTDLFDFHCYDKFDELQEHIHDLANLSKISVNKIYAPNENIKYNHQPTQISEFGGVSFKIMTTSVKISNCIDSQIPWGYNTVIDEQEFVDNYIKQATLLLSCKKLSGFCYTQLYDIEQEQNGFFTFERVPKLKKESMDKIAQINSIIAAIEE